MRANYDDSAGILLDTLHWDNLSLRREKLKAGLMYKTLKGNMPSYLQDMFSFRGLGYNIRNSEIRLNLPKPRTNYLKRSFRYNGAILWNSLPQDIRKPQSFAQFKKAIAEYYNSNYLLTESEVFTVKLTYRLTLNCNNTSIPRPKFHSELPMCSLLIYMFQSTVHWFQFYNIL